MQQGKSRDGVGGGQAIPWASPRMMNSIILISSDETGQGRGGVGIEGTERFESFDRIESLDSFDYARIENCEFSD